MTICPCCGFKSANSLSGVLSADCLSCGAHPVGEPLPRPEHELPSYARSLMLAVSGALIVLVFLTQTIIAMFQRSSRGAISNLAAFSMIPFDLWSWIAAAETAAWRLKWVMIPVTLLVVFVGRKIYRSMQAEPSRFCGVRYARNGYAASVAVPVLMLILIGVTVPERLQQRADGVQAGVNAAGYTFGRAFSEYTLRFGRVPDDLADLKQLPDADGSIAAALKDLDPVAFPNAYRPYAEVAAKQKPNTLRGALISKASLGSATADDSITEALSFTDYDLRLPGADRLMDTDDDLLVRNGVIYNTTDPLRPGISSAPSTQTRKP